jgi:hypothetical protein
MTQIEKVRNTVLEIIKQHLPEGVKYDVRYDSKYDVFDIYLFARKIGGNREACAKVAAVAILLSYYNSYDWQRYECHGYDHVTCSTTVWVQKFRDVIMTYQDALKEAYRYCDKIFSEVEEEMRRREEEERRKREKYERWRREKLGNCYADKLDYDIAVVSDLEVGRGVTSVLKPGDRILLEVLTHIDPCFVETKDNYIYVERYIPYDSSRCRRTEFDVFTVVRLPLYIRGRLPASHAQFAEDGTPVVFWPENLVLAGYKGDGVLEILQDADRSDYDYYLHMLMFTAHSTDAEFHVGSVTGASWYSAHECQNDVIRNLMTREWSWIENLGYCGYAPTLFMPILIRRGEETKVRFSVWYYTGKEEEREVTISTKTFPPTVSFRNLTYERERRENLGDCRAEKLSYDVYTIRYAGIGHGIAYMLKPGDRVAVEINTSADPCFLQPEELDNTLPAYGTKCECTKLRRKYMLFELPLRIRGRVKERGNVLVAEYKGNGVLEIADGADYDYYLTTFMYESEDKNAKFSSIEVKNAVWYSAYFLHSYELLYMDENGNWERMYTLANCCNDEIPALIIPILIRRGEKAEVKFKVGDKNHSVVVYGGT